MRVNDGDREIKAPEAALPVVVLERTVASFAPLSWGDSGNVVAAASVALLNMVGGR